ncbi:MAG: hydroxymethylbilane synthase [Chloroflexi bacterium]|nr:hydroxymethylbilane synthase [Chloroflexota bacterium]
MPANTIATIRVGTRGSALALRQTGMLVDALAETHSDVRFELVEILSRGDADRTSDLTQLGVGIFVKALEDALEDGRVDLAIHSLKDMPSVTRHGFELAAVTAREDPREALVNRWNSSFADLPEGARIGTGSPRRRSQLLSARPDLNVLPMRGNVPTRITKALAGPEGGYDGAVLAAAGLSRLGRLDEAADLLDPSIFVPAAGQGSLAVEIRAGDSEAREIAAAVADEDATIASLAERAFLTELGGGCSVPVAAYGQMQDGSLMLSGFVSDLDGKKALRETIAGDPGRAAGIGVELARNMAAHGARELLAEIPRG